MRKMMLLLGAAVCACATPVLAHHSFAMFDRSKPMTVVGTVKQFQWTNPHSWLQVVAPPGGKTRAGEWSIEMTSPNVLMRKGWKPGSVKPGDKVIVNIYPLRDGSMGGQFRSVTLSDGRVLTQEGSPTAGH